MGDQTCLAVTVYGNIWECFPAHNFVSSSVAVSADRIMGVLRQRFCACTLTHGESLSGFGLIPLITDPSDYAQEIDHEAQPLIYKSTSVPF